MRNIDLRRLRAGLAAVGPLTGVRFALAVARNARLVEDRLTDLETATKPSEDYAAYARAHNTLCVANSVKDDEGRPVQVPGPEGSTTYQIEDQEAHNTACQALLDASQDAVKAQAAKMEIWSDEVQGLELVLVPENELPPDISAAQLHAVYEMIDHAKPA